MRNRQRHGRRNTFHRLRLPDLQVQLFERGGRAEVTASHAAAERFWNERLPAYPGETTHGMAEYTCMRRARRQQTLRSRQQAAEDDDRLTGRKEL